MNESKTNTLERNKMAELRDEHFEVISENFKAKAHEQQKDMRDELAFFVMNCSQFKCKNFIQR